MEDPLQAIEVDGGRARPVPPLARMALVLLALQGLLHGLAALQLEDPRLLAAHLVALLHDALLLLLPVSMQQGMERLLPRRFRPFLLLVNGGLLLGLGLLLASYPLLLAEYVRFPVRLQDADPSLLCVFLVEVLGAGGLAGLAAVLLLATFSVCYPFRLRIRLPPAAVGALVISSLLVAALRPTRMVHLPVQPHPLVHSLEEGLADLLTGNERVVPPLRRPSRPAQGEGIVPPVRSPLETAGPLRFDHVLVMVMETVEEPDFQRDFLEHPQGFASRVEDQAVRFRGYHSTNLDSYTSLLAMLGSVQVPYRAYADPQLFEELNQLPGLVSALATHGFASLFVCTALHQPFIPHRDRWDQLIQGTDLPDPERWASVGVNRVEAALEDRAALPAILEFVRSHPRTLVMQEMVFGHSPRWTQLTGMSQLDYYDRFLCELHQGLIDAGLEERCLLVVVADHGDRTEPARVESYHVPLLIAGHGIPPGVDERLRTHLDLQGILGHYLAGLDLPPPARDVLLVGHTGRWTYGLMDASGDHVFLDAERGTVLSQRGLLAPIEAHRRFQAELDAFARYQLPR